MRGSYFVLLSRSNECVAFVKPGFGRYKSGIQISEKTYEIIKRYYVAMRNTVGGVESIPPRDSYNIRSYMACGGESAEDWITYTETAIAEHCMIVLLSTLRRDLLPMFTICR